MPRIPQTPNAPFEDCKKLEPLEHHEFCCFRTTPQSIPFELHVEFYGNSYSASIEVHICEQKAKNKIKERLSKSAWTYSSCIPALQRLKLCASFVAWFLLSHLSIKRNSRRLYQFRELARSFKVIWVVCSISTCPLICVSRVNTCCVRWMAHLSF